MNYDWNRVVKDINTLLMAEEGEIPEPPELSITDDIGCSEGFDVLVKAKMQGKSDMISYQAEVNSDQCERFDPSKRSHKFSMDFRYKDISGINDAIKDMPSLIKLSAYSESVDSLIRNMISDGVKPELNTIIKEYEAIATKAAKELSKRKSSLSS